MVLSVAEVKEEEVEVRAEVAEEVDEEAKGMSVMASSFMLVAESAFCLPAARSY